MLKRLKHFYLISISVFMGLNIALVIEILNRPAQGQGQGFRPTRISLPAHIVRPGDSLSANNERTIARFQHFVDSLHY